MGACLSDLSGGNYEVAKLEDKQDICGEDYSHTCIMDMDNVPNGITCSGQKRQSVILGSTELSDCKRLCTSAASHVSREATDPEGIKHTDLSSGTAVQLESNRWPNCNSCASAGTPTDQISEKQEHSSKEGYDKLNRVILPADNEVKESRPGSYVDHINELPQSLILRILHHLTLQDRLHRASLVCKYWYDLCHDPGLWRIIHLSGQMKVDDTVLDRVTQYSDNVTKLDISDSRLVSNQGVCLVTARCTQLQILKLVRCQQLTDEAFISIGKNCHKLHALYLDSCCAVSDDALAVIGKGCPKLTVASLNQCGRITDDGVIHLAQGCPNLKKLMVDQCTKLTDKCLHVLVDGCPSLENLSCMSCAFTEDGLLSLTRLPNMKILELSYVRSVTKLAVKEIVKKCTQLECLNLCLCSNVDDHCVEFIAKHATKLKNLHCVSCNITDKALGSLGTFSKTIKHVDFGWCANITDEGVREISAKSTSLQYLGLMRCDKVTNASMKALVAKYPHITYSTVWLDAKRLFERARQEGYNITGDVMRLF